MLEWDQVAENKKKYYSKKKVKDKKGKFPPSSGERRERRRRSSTTIYLSFKLCWCLVARFSLRRERKVLTLPPFLYEQITNRQSPKKYDEKRQQYITVATVLYSSDPVTLTHRHKNKEYKKKEPSLLFSFAWILKSGPRFILTVGSCCEFFFFFTIIKSGMAPPPICGRHVLDCM